MDEAELLQTLARGEDSQHQFKREVSNVDGLAAELIAFANGGGGDLFIGVRDDGQIEGLTTRDVARINQLLSNAASQHVRPPLNPTTKNVQTAHGIVMVVHVEQGLHKPYVDHHGRVWVKSGADKRHVTAREELQRQFQTAGLVQADEVPVQRASLADLDLQSLDAYFTRRYGRSIQAHGLALPQLLHNLNLARDGVPNLAGVLLFGKAPQHLKPAFVVKAVALPGTVLHDSRYLDSETLEGPLAELYSRSMAFLNRNLRHVQSGASFNSPSRLEVPPSVFEELLVNALVHRDYLISAPIRLLVFADRVELISPGHLPNHLDVGMVRYGLSNLRNPALASHAFHLLPYQGLGSGIPRATQEWPDIEFVDDRLANQFSAVVRRHQLSEEEARPESQPESRPESSPQPESPPESQQESRPESAQLAQRVMAALQDGPASKAELAKRFGQQKVSGQLNKVIRDLLASGTIAHTLPDKPNSRLQKYRLIARP